MKSIPFEMSIESDIEVMRAETFWTKEPETLAWIDTMPKWDHFIDVGANIGIYSLYAASRGMAVDAFEPDPKNFARLRKNIKLNPKIMGTIIEHAVAVTDRSGLGRLAVVNDENGSSGSQFNVMVNEGGGRIFPTAVLATVGLTLDDFKVMNLPQNVHVKIDVDGQELKVLAGMVETLKDKCLKSVLIEVNGPDRGVVATAVLIANGFKLDKNLMKMPNHSTFRREKDGIPARNLIFRRVN
jgi:FkbM family methyltransferase